MINEHQFTVTLWFKVNNDTMKYKEQLTKTVEAFPYQAFENNGLADMHWGFETEAQARMAIERLNAFFSDPNIIVMRFFSNDPMVKSETYKYQRSALTTA